VTNHSSSDAERDTRWRSEASFFDAWAEKALAEVKPMDPATLKRYTTGLNPLFHKDYRIRLLGDLRGKNILDVGCGDGVNSILLAKLGGNVTGIDISPGAIAVATKKAEVDGVTKTCRFLCGPVETVDVEKNSFDIIWGDAILHHVISELPLVMAKLVEYCKPGGLMVFGEPVNFNRTLRKIRFMVPVSTDATPDERPLEPQEIDIVRKFLPDLKMSHFTLLGRLTRFVLPDWNYEGASAVRRGMVYSLCLADRVMLSLPVIKNMGGIGVFYGHPRPAVKD
jgi:2-polyprenyl-3-methyl-5-hydroxy-6-metoxy-1,4-benzoquinol methylase